MEATGSTAMDSPARGEQVVKAAASPAAQETRTVPRSAAVSAETKTETDRESVGSSDSARGQEREAVGEAQEEAAASESGGNAATSESKPVVGASEAVDRKMAKKQTPAAKMPSKAKVVSARKTFDVIHRKRLEREPTLAERAKMKSDKALKKTPAKAAPSIKKTLSFSAVKVRGERSTTLKDDAKTRRSGFGYTPYKGPLPPFSNSLFAPKEVQALERLEHRAEKPKTAAPAPKKPFLMKSTGKAGGVIGRATSSAGKENAHVNTPASGADKNRRRLAETDKKPKATSGGARVSVKDKSTLSFQAKVRMDRRATVSSAAKARATQARQTARQSTPATARPTAKKAAATS